MAKTLRAAESGWRYSTTSDMNILSCANCGIMFGITADFEQRRRDDHESFYCPNGHSNVYRGENETEKAKREAQRAKERAARLAAELEQKKSALHGQKIRASRFKNDRDRERRRVANGTCPCCNRHFKDLHRHMTSQHPDHGVPDPE